MVMTMVNDNNDAEFVLLLLLYHSHLITEVTMTARILSNKDFLLLLVVYHSH